MNIYVGNLSYEITEADLLNAFSSFGEVVSVKVITDQHSGRSKGFGFIEMPSRTEAEAAIKGLNSSKLQGGQSKLIKPIHDEVEIAVAGEKGRGILAKDVIRMRFLKTEQISPQDTFDAND